MPSDAWEAIVKTWGITGLIVAGVVVAVQQVVKIVLSARYQPHVMAAREARRLERLEAKANPHLRWRHAVLRGVSLQWSWVEDRGEQMVALDAATCSSCQRTVRLEDLYVARPVTCACGRPLGPFAHEWDIRSMIAAEARRRFPPRKFPHLIFAERGLDGQGPGGWIRG